MPEVQRRAAITMEKLARKPLAVRQVVRQVDAYTLQEKNQSQNAGKGQSAKDKTSWYLLMGLKVHVEGKIRLPVKVVFSLIHFFS